MRQLDYAWQTPHTVSDKWGGLGATTLLLGMNPGPWGITKWCAIRFYRHCKKPTQNKNLIN